MTTRAGYFRKSVRKFQTQGFDLRICEPISYRKHFRICGKKLKNLPLIQKAKTSSVARGERGD